MKTVRLTIIGMVLTTLFAFSAMAQAGNGKIAVINTYQFGVEKGGITKYVNAQKRLDNEFRVEDQQLKSLLGRINALKREIATLQKQANPNVPVDPKSVNNKIQQHDSLAREYKFKEENAKAKYKKRAGEVLGPINQDLGVALQEFRQKNGYSMILDAAGLERAGLILAFDRTFDVTKQFIAFYNARPATRTAVVRK